MVPENGINSDMDGSAPDQCGTALLLVDVINHFEFPDAPELLQNWGPAALRLAELKRRAKSHGIPVVYVNDNFGKWRSSFAGLLAYCTRPEARGREVVSALAPHEDDYFVLKPKHSGFYQTPLEILLTNLGTKKAIIAGVTTNNCVLFTASDAYMRDLQVQVPRDCVAAASVTAHETALEHIATVLKANVAAATEMSLGC
jgi:nicotinamidase-related amidase